jgi:hypothetical protein
MQRWLTYLLVALASAILLLSASPSLAAQSIPAARAQAAQLQARLSVLNSQMAQVASRYDVPRATVGALAAILRQRKDRLFEAVHGGGQRLATANTVQYRHAQPSRTSDRAALARTAPRLGPSWWPSQSRCEGSGSGQAHVAGAASATGGEGPPSICRRASTRHNGLR